MQTYGSTPPPPQSRGSAAVQTCVGTEGPLNPERVLAAAKELVSHPLRHVNFLSIAPFSQFRAPLASTQPPSAAPRSRRGEEGAGLSTCTGER